MQQAALDIAGREWQFEAYRSNVNRSPLNLLDFCQPLLTLSGKRDILLGELFFLEVSMSRKPKGRVLYVPGAILPLIEKIIYKHKAGEALSNLKRLEAEMQEAA